MLSNDTRSILRDKTDFTDINVKMRNVSQLYGKEIRFESASLGM